MSSLILIIILMFGVYSGDDCHHFKLWTQVEAAYYALNILFTVVYYKNINRTNRESLKFLLTNCSLNVIHTGWLVYGNVLFWPNYDYCGSKL